MDELAVQHLKTYQVWHHRRLLVQLAVQRENGSATSMGVDLDARSGTNVGVGVGVSEAVRRELTFTTHCLHTDTKNYHTWSYRQWLLAHFCIGNIDDGTGSSSLWADEYTFVDEMLAVDVRNNSAWHHRFVVVFQTGVRVGEEDREEVVRKELTYVCGFFLSLFFSLLVHRVLRALSLLLIELTWCITIDTPRARSPSRPTTHRHGTTSAVCSTTLTRPTPFSDPSSRLIAPHRSPILSPTSPCKAGRKKK